MFGDIYSSKQFYPGIDVTNEFELKNTTIRMDPIM